MSFITTGTTVITEPINAPVDLQGSGTYYAGIPNSFTITNFDSFTTYTVSSSNGTVSQSTSTINFTPSGIGSQSFVINGRTVTMTVLPIANYLLQGLYTSSSNTSIEVDSSFNAYVTSNQSGVSQLTKINQNSGNEWAKSVTASGIAISDSVADAAGNVYVCGGIGGVGFIAKFDSSGNILFQNQYSTATTFYAIGINSAGTLITACGDNGATVGCVTQINASGVKQWARSVTAASQVTLRGLAVDSTGSVIVGGRIADGVSANIYGVLKYSSAGALTWQRSCSVTGELASLCVDSSNNIYTCGVDVVGGTRYLVALTSAGAARWSATVTGGTTSTATGMTAAAVDNLGGAYFAGGDAGSPFGCILVKVNATTGAQVWERRLSSTSGAIRTRTIAISQTDFLIANNAASASQFTNADLPTDGTKTGSYTLGSQTVAYASGFYSVAAAAVTTGAGLATDAADAGTFSTSAATLAAVTPAPVRTIV